MNVACREDIVTTDAATVPNLPGRKQVINKMKSRPLQIPISFLRNLLFYTRSPRPFETVNIGQ